MFIHLQTVTTNNEKFTIYYEKQFHPHAAATEKTVLCCFTYTLVSSYFTFSKVVKKARVTTLQNRLHYPHLQF